MVDTVDQHPGHAVAAVGYEGAQYFVKLTAWHGLFRTAADGRQRAIVIEQ